MARWESVEFMSIGAASVGCLETPSSIMEHSGCQTYAQSPSSLSAATDFRAAAAISLTPSSGLFASSSHHRKSERAFPFELSQAQTGWDRNTWYEESIFRCNSSSRCRKKEIEKDADDSSTTLGMVFTDGMRRTLAIWSDHMQPSDWCLAVLSIQYSCYTP
jgi:hypothetical protein